MRNELGTMKEHYKSYKAGKRWLFACITVMSLGLGMVGAETTVQADTTSNNDGTPSAIQPASSSTSSQEHVLQSGSQSSNSDVPDTKADSEINDEPTDVDGGPTDSDEVKDDTPAPATDPNANVNDDKVNTDKGNTADSSKPAGEESQQSEEKTSDDIKAPEENNVEASDDVVKDDATKPVSTTTNQVNVHDLQEMPSTLGAAKFSRSSLLKSATSSIAGVDASVWMPDANLRAWIEGYLSSNWHITINDANLSQYVGKVTALADGYGATIGNPTPSYAGSIQSFEGLQYFTKLARFSYYKGIPADKVVDFSFAPGLTSLYISGSGTSTGMDVATLFQGLTTNTALQNITLKNCGLTGQLPNLAKFTSLQSLDLSGNMLTGDLSNLGTLPRLTDLMVNDNELTGAVPSLATLPSLSYFVASNNRLSALPDMSNYTGYMEILNNALTNGLQNPGMNNLISQKVTGKEYVLTPTVRSFDPITDVLQGVQGSDGQIDLTDPMVAYNLGTPGVSYFTVAPDPDNALGFLLVADADTPDGTYTIEVWNQKTHQYNVDLTFTVKNGKDPVKPDPDTKDPDANTNTPGGTTTPDTTTTTPDTPVTGGDADEIVAPTTDDSTTATPLTGGDSATIDTTTPATKVATKSAGQADQVVKGTTKRNSQPVTLVAKNSSRIVRGTKAPVAHQRATASQPLATKQTATQTTLPQTNEQNSAELIAAGVAVALATLGMGVKVRHN
ncbi:KxYKxGKxW signal peptide domain-containing protein [Levilactobacillus angrenensis]|uniref:KxYKxGKxW signal peptide domain-containing protein n=1 Tax=Levilactobacillus angrenensis TaxID=2486020 RepID=A0ABW1UAN3_9LACO|nr:KxYKxGKxW signal peptide domain-containing protein [Levilactobacillus angrenensis]